MQCPVSDKTFDFDIASIKVRPGTDNWGPFNFDFSDALPAGTTITSVDVESYLEDSDAESTSQLIDSSTANSGVVDVYFQYPGDDWVGRHYLRFKLTLSGDQKPTFQFGYVEVES